MRSNILLLALMLAGCGSQSGQTSNAVAPVASPTTVTVNTTAPVADTAADTAAIRAAIDKGYGGYNTGGDNGGNGFTNSPDFDAAWQRAVGKDGALDYDPYCQCQDFGKVRWQVDNVAITGDTARADIRLDVFSTGEWKKTWIDFRRVDGNWLVDDVADDGGNSVKAGMKAAEPGSMGVGN